MSLRWSLSPPRLHPHGLALHQRPRALVSETLSQELPSRAVLVLWGHLVPRAPESKWDGFRPSEDSRVREKRGRCRRGEAGRTGGTDGVGGVGRRSGTWTRRRGDRDGSGGVGLWSQGLPKFKPGHRARRGHEKPPALPLLHLPNPSEKRHPEKTGQPLWNARHLPFRATLCSLLMPFGTPGNLCSTPGPATSLTWPHPLVPVLYGSRGLVQPRSASGLEPLAPRRTPPALNPTLNAPTGGPRANAPRWTLCTHAATRMGLQGIMLHEKSQSQEVTRCRIPFIEHF